MGLDLAHLVPLIPFVALIGFDGYCLGDLARAREVRLMEKPIWAAVICLLGPFGGIIYLYMGRMD